MFSLYHCCYDFQSTQFAMISSQGWVMTSNTELETSTKPSPVLIGIMGSIPRQTDLDPLSFCYDIPSHPLDSYICCGATASQEMQRCPRAPLPFSTFKTGKNLSRMC